VFVKIFETFIIIDWKVTGKVIG